MNVTDMQHVIGNYNLKKAHCICIELVTDLMG